MAELDVNRDGVIDANDDINHDGKIDNKDRHLEVKHKKKIEEEELKGVITKETLIPEAVLVQAFTQAEFYLELQYPLHAIVEGPIDIVWTPATGALDVEFKTGTKSNESVGFTKALTPNKKKDSHHHGAHYKLKYDNIVTEIGIDPSELPFSFVSGRDADPFVRIINGTLYIRLALEELTMAQAVVHMNVNEAKKNGMKLEGSHNHHNANNKEAHDPQEEHDEHDKLQRLTTEQALLDM